MSIINRLENMLLKGRTKYEHLPSVLKYLAIFINFILFVVSILALIPFPELGIPLAVISLSILSFEFHWAQRALDKIINLASSVLLKATAGITVAVVIGIIILLILR